MTYSKIFTWASEALEKLEQPSIGPIEEVRLMPWSKVWRMPTTRGPVYLKQVRHEFGIEIKLLPFLARSIYPDAPRVLALEPVLMCFIMADAGQPLREKLKQSYDIDCISHLMRIYIAIQKKSINQIEQLQNIDLPDWRSLHLPYLLENLIDQDDGLKAYGLPDAEIKSLREALPKFHDVCTAMARAPIPHTIDHCDFHDNNVLLKDEQITIADWGDAVISHPFLSLAGFLHSAMKAHQFYEDDPRFTTTRDIYLNEWLEYGDYPTLLQLFELARPMRHAQFALSFARLYNFASTEDLKDFSTYMADTLRALTKQIDKCEICV